MKYSYTYMMAETRGGFVFVWYYTSHISDLETVENVLP